MALSLVPVEIHFWGHPSGICWASHFKLDYLLLDSNQ